MESTTISEPTTEVLPSPLKKHLSHILRVVDGKHDRTTVDSRGLRIDMVCNDHGFWGDITLEFSKLDEGGNPQHVMTYESELAGGKVKMGEITYHDEDEPLLVGQLRAALIELEYPNELPEEPLLPEDEDDEE